MRTERSEMLEQNPRMELARPKAGSASQRRQLQIALVLLLIALGVVIGKNRDFWFGSDEAQESDAAGSQIIAKTNPVTLPAKAAVQTPVVVTGAPKKQLAHKASTQPTAKAPASTESADLHSPVVAANRTVLPPLEVEVVAGDAHRVVRPGSNVTKVEIPSDPNRASTVTTEAALPANAAQRERLANVGVPELRQTVDATYPLLGQHTSVQGSVVLQAVVGTDGSIEDLRVVSGPAILTLAAQQAVRQWRFKPYLQNGQPVETKARITVNFSIKVSDNPAKTS
jgi:TonB family protein